MANEISLNATLRVAKGYLDQQRERSRNFSLVAAAPAKAGGVMIVGTTHEAISLGDVATPGWCWFENLDPTNYVEIGVVVSSTFYPVIKLKPGEFQPCRLGTTAPYAKANTASVKLDYEIFED